MANRVGNIAEKKEEELSKKVAEEVSLQVVGESCYRWDSVPTCFPTLSFTFREIDVEQGPRRAQIKVRLKERNEEVEEAKVPPLDLAALAGALPALPWQIMATQQQTPCGT